MSTRRLPLKFYLKCTGLHYHQHYTSLKRTYSLLLFPKASSHYFLGIATNTRLLLTPGRASPPAITILFCHITNGVVTGE